MSDQVKQLQSQVDQLEERITELEKRLDGGETVEAEEDLRAFVESLGPSSHTERSLYIAYYMEKYRDEDTFTVEDIEEGYRECRVKSAGNMSDVLGRMEERDWLLRDGKQGRTQLWSLTATALNNVKEELNNDS